MHLFPVTRAALRQARTATRGAPYQWAVIALGHAWVGAALSTLIPAPQAAAVVLVGLVYLLAWEMLFQRGRDVPDMLADSAFVALGAAYLGPAWVPWVIFGVVVVGLELGLSDRGGGLMTKSSGLYRDEIWGILLAVLISLLVVQRFVWSASYWFEVGQISVSVVEGEILVTYPRQIHRGFDGAWRVKIWQEEGEFLRRICATGENREDYSPRTYAELKWPLLDYTENESCMNLPAGCFVMHTDWDINLSANPLEQLIFGRSVHRETRFCLP